MEHDVLIIGAGPTGAIAAKRLAEEGYRVLVLEQGDWPDYSKATVHQRGLPAHRGPGLGLGSEPAPGPRRLSHRRHRVRHHGADVERRRRRDRGVRGAVAAQHAVGLPREDARRDRRRLAADLRGPRAVLRARRARLRHLRPGERHRVPARRRAAAPARAAGARGPAGGEGAQRAGLALVAGAERDRHARLRRAARLPAGRHLPAGLRLRREGHGGPHALAEGDRARGRAAHRRAGPRADRAAGRPGGRRVATWTADGNEHEARAGDHDPGGERRRHAAAAAALG